MNYKINVSAIKQSGDPEVPVIQTRVYEQVVNLHTQDHLVSRIEKVLNQLGGTNDLEDQTITITVEPDPAPEA